MATDAERAWDLMASLRFCMLCTWTGDKLHARPMAALVRRHENAIYFFTDRGAQKDDEIARFPEVCIAFADPNGQTYVSVCGRAQIVQDRAKVKELWSLPAKAWWGDPDNPNLLLVKVSPTEAEFWDPPGNVLSSLRVAFALAKGGPPPHPPHEHRHVSLP